MRQTHEYRQHHRPRSLPRRILGWTAIVAGLAMLVLPGPGLLALALGVILVGRHDPFLRRWAVIIRLYLRRLSRAEQRELRRFGGWLRRQHHHARAYIRTELHRHARGEPLSTGVRIWIGFTIISAVVGLGASLFLLLF